MTIAWKWDSLEEVRDWWSIQTTYSYLQVQFQKIRAAWISLPVAESGNDPQNQVYMRSSMDLPQHTELDFTVRYVGALPNQKVPDYFAADVKLAWRPNEHLEFAIVGQNLFDNLHPEFGTGGQHEIPRSHMG